MINTEIRMIAQKWNATKAKLKLYLRHGDFIEVFNGVEK